ncbi:hypothetical protein HDV05_007719 [Chytridiales sp. JEL 0842]|nr:hypothetical protein HDV05_007719 [Chytridiales sp. JEL 0842]
MKKPLTSTGTPSAAVASANKTAGAAAPQRPVSGGNTTTKNTNSTTTTSREGKTKRVSGPEDNRETAGFAEGEEIKIDITVTPEQLAELQDLPLEESLNKMASHLNLSKWREDMQSNIFLSLYFNLWQFAKENNFTTYQVPTMLGIMKMILEKSTEKGLSVQNSVKLFRRLLCSNVATSDEEAPREVLSPAEAKLFVDHVMTGYFQHYRLYQFIQTNEQEQEVTEISVQIEHPDVPPPLAEAITLEAYEAEVARVREIEEREREERLRREAEERAISNPFEALSPEEIKAVATEAIAFIMKDIGGEVDKLMEDQRERFMAQLKKYSIVI